MLFHIRSKGFLLHSCHWKTLKLTTVTVESLLCIVFFLNNKGGDTITFAFTFSCCFLELHKVDLTSHQTDKCKYQMIYNDPTCWTNIVVIFNIIPSLFKYLFKTFLLVWVKDNLFLDNLHFPMKVVLGSQLELLVSLVVWITLIICLNMYSHFR